MCINTIKRWLGITTTNNATLTIPHSDEATDVTLTIPHPEEAPDSTKTMENTDIVAALEQWMVDYNVPAVHHDHWKNQIEITLDNTLPYPAAAYDLNGVRHLTIRPEWVNPGVIAHEQAHNSYALLNEQEKSGFSKIFTPLKTKNKLIAYLFSINSYGLTNDIEGHAEVYRYFAEKMPQELKEYYPKLF